MGWIRRNVLRMDDEEIKLIDKEIDDEKKAGFEVPTEVQNAVTQQKMMTDIQMDAQSQQMAQQQDMAAQQNNTQEPEQTSATDTQKSQQRKPKAVNSSADLSLSEDSIVRRLTRIL
jgi:hypothetical protein